MYALVINKVAKHSSLPHEYITASVYGDNDSVSQNLCYVPYPRATRNIHMCRLA